MTDNIKNNHDEAVLAEQASYMDRVRKILLSRYKTPPKAFIHTYGCQQNVSDSERMQGLLKEMGYEFCDTPDEADFVLYNTCAVREHAEDRVWGNVGLLKKFKKARPDMIIAVCGCMTQQQKNADRLKRSFPYVDLVFVTAPSRLGFPLCTDATTSAPTVSFPTSEVASVPVVPRIS